MTENNIFISGQTNTELDLLGDDQAQYAQEVVATSDIGHDVSVDDQTEGAETCATVETPLPAPALSLTTRSGQVYCGDSLQLLRNQNVIKPGSVNLIMTSPPFGLVRKKEYGNVDADCYFGMVSSVCRSLL